MGGSEAADLRYGVNEAVSDARVLKRGRGFPLDPPWRALAGPLSKVRNGPSRFCYQSRGSVTCMMRTRRGGEGPGP